MRRLCTTARHLSQQMRNALRGSTQISRIFEFFGEDALAKPDDEDVFRPVRFGDTDAEFLVLLGKDANGVWGGSVTRGPERVDLPSGSLVDVILAAKYPIEGRFPMILAVAEHRSALRYGDIRLKVVEQTEIDAEELLCLIDAKGGGYGLDLSGCKIRNLDLSRSWIEERWDRDPDAGTNVEPRWKSHETDGINLRDACLNETRFWHVNLTHADLDAASLKAASFSSCELEWARLMRANLAGAFLSHTNFHRAKMMGANFSGAHVLECEFVETHLSNTDWRGADVLESLFTGASLRTAHLEGVDLFSPKPKSLSGVSWGSAFLDRTRIRREQLDGELAEETEARTGKRLITQTSDEGYEEFVVPADYREDMFRQAREAYMAHKINFASIGRYADASWAYQKERAMERGRLFRACQLRKPRSWSNLWKWLVSRVECGLTGYGERPWRTTVAAALTILLFAVVYDVSNAIVANGTANEVASGYLCFWDALLYSAATFFTAGVAAFAPANRIAQGLVVVESALGLGLFALLIFTLGNRISRS